MNPQRTCDRHRRKVAAGARGQVSEQWLKAKLPMLLTELIPLDKKGKEAGVGKQTYCLHHAAEYSTNAPLW